MTAAVADPGAALIDLAERGDWRPGEDIPIEIVRMAMRICGVGAGVVSIEWAQALDDLLESVHVLRDLHDGITDAATVLGDDWQSCDPKADAIVYREKTRDDAVKQLLAGQYQAADAGGAL